MNCRTAHSRLVDMASISAAGPLRGRSGSLRTVLKRVADAAVTPLELGDVLDVFHPLRRGREGLQGRIVSIVPETAESATVVIKPGRDWSGHVPGQYVRIGVDVDGVRMWRTYSLTHGPRPDRNLSFTVKAIPGGVVSQHLVHSAKVGQMIQLEQAEGEFVLPVPMPPKLLLVTAGSGITPVIGMLRNLFSRRAAPQTDITLVHVNQNADTAIFRDELRAHGAAGNLTLIERYERLTAEWEALSHRALTLIARRSRASAGHAASSGLHARSIHDRRAAGCGADGHTCRGIHVQRTPRPPHSRRPAVGARARPGGAHRQRGRCVRSGAARR